MSNLSEKYSQIISDIEKRLTKPEDKTYVIKKIEELSKLRYENDLNFEIEVDGGINTDNIEKVAKLGGDIFVAGNAVFGAKDREQAISKLKELIR